MIEEDNSRFREGTALADGLSCGLATEQDLDAAAQVFVAQFPGRAAEWFAKPSQALCFYRDMMELLWRAHGSSFFVARHGRSLKGYLVLTVPGRRMWRGVSSPSFLLKVIAHGIAGRYGLRAIPRIGRELAGFGGSPEAEKMAVFPCIYVVAAAGDFTGKGLGTMLINRAKSYCQGRFSRLWLYVEKENGGAIRLYERLGFRTIASEEQRLMMACELAASENAEQSGCADRAEASRV